MIGSAAGTARGSVPRSLSAGTTTGFSMRSVSPTAISCLALAFFALAAFGALVRWVFADFGIARRFALLLVAISPASFL